MSTAGLVAALAERDWDDLSLAAGAAGAAVALHDLERAGVEVPAGAAQRCLDAAVEGLASAPLGPGLFGGFTGIAWAVAHIEGSTGLEEIDEALARWLHGPVAPDLTHGAVGAGAYALEAGNEELLALAAARAGEHLDVEDLGMAHGLAGVVALLAAAEEPDLLRSAVDRLLGHDREDLGFPATVGASGPCRVSWCYGDLGTACALTRAADGLDDEGLRRRAAATARRAAAQPLPGIVDAGVCHGAAGAAHLFTRLGLDDAAASWRERARRLGPPDDPGLLLGTAGVALALAGADGWDRFLLI